MGQLELPRKAITGFNFSNCWNVWENVRIRTLFSNSIISDKMKLSKRSRGSFYEMQKIICIELTEW